MIVFISDFDLRGSGYMNIAVSLCNELASRHGRRVTALGLGYDMSEHNWPFSIIPVKSSQYLGHIPAILHNFRYLASGKQWHPVECIISALDVPIQEKLLMIDRGNIPYVGIFPVESGPLCNSWAASLSTMSERLVISEFGAKMIEDAGLDATYLPVGIDTQSWRRPSNEERAIIRKSLGYTEDEFVLLTVADNQERKNLSLAAEMVATARKSINAKWVLVTRVNSPVGWKLDDLAAQFDITDSFTKFDRGLPFERLWFLYAASDALLLTSKAEGLCLPVLEAMACGLPVIATDCTAIPEHIYSDPDWDRVRGGVWNKGKPSGRRGFEIPVEFTNIDPWGNSVRSFPSAEDGAKAIIKLAKTPRNKLESMMLAAREYAEARTWRKAGDVLNEMISRAIANARPEEGDVQEDSAFQAMTGLPAAIPRPVPEVRSEE